MQKPRADFLSGSRFPSEEDRQRSRGQPSKQRLNPAHRRRDAKSALRGIAHAQRHDFAHLLKQARELERLGQIVLRAGANERDRLIDLPERRHKNERRRERAGVCRAENLLAVHVRQPNVAEHEVRTKLGHPVHGFLAGLPPNGAPALELKRPLERFAHDRIVIDDRDASQTHSAWTASTPTGPACALRSWQILAEGPRNPDERRQAALLDDSYLSAFVRDETAHDPESKAAAQRRALPRNVRRGIWQGRRAARGLGRRLRS